MKKILIGSIIVAFLVVSVGIVMAKPAGYNWKANVFVGTGMQWCMEKFDDEPWCTTNYGPWGNDKLKMKWSKAWHMAVFGPDDIRGGNDTLSWSEAVDQYGSAWVDNQWNGMFPGGSGEVWHYKIKWVSDPENPIWGQFETLMDHGTVKHVGHDWWGHVIPSGYGQ